MGANSAIEWTDHTFNPWIGCTKVSEACFHCYAETLMATRYGRVEWGPGKPRVRTSVANWRLPLRWNREEQGKMVDHAGFVSARRPRVFCASLADWLDDEVPLEWLADLLGLIRSTPHIDWLLLTKRPQLWRERVSAVAESGFPDSQARAGMHLAEDWFGGGEPPANVWVGTTVENQRRADERIPELLKIPARVRFLSCEPLLGSIDLTHVTIFQFAHDYDRVNALRGHETHCSPGFRGLRMECGASKEPRIHWVICGGESGPGARPMHPNWARQIRAQCEEASVPFLFKQWGEWTPATQVGDRVEIMSAHPVPKSPEWFTCPTGELLARVGKHAAGRLLDGVEHNATP